jgi:succinyldiaminopimelate transaminase
MTDDVGFVPPPYPHDRLHDLKPLADRHEGGLVDFSIGSPMDPPTDAVVAALGESGLERGYPPSIGRLELREAISVWMERRLAVKVSPEHMAATIGTKEFVVGLPHLLKLRTPGRDTVLYPEIAYPSYEMGAILAGCRAVPVPVDDDWAIRIDAIDDADSARALCLWVNTPGNPAGGLDDLGAAAEWGRKHQVPVFSDECYVEFTWDGPRHTILEHGTEGLVAVHSLSKRSNLAGVRVGFYAGDPELVHYLREVRKHAGFMVPGPAQAAAEAALADDEHVEVQKVRYMSRLNKMQSVLAALGVDVDLPRGGFYLWAAAPGGDAWALTRRLVEEAGALVAPGEFYGSAGKGHVRIAVVQPDDRVDLVASRLGL